MCGICGFYGFRNDSLLNQMTDSIKHRGPDDCGYYKSKDVSLGHRRLSIIDLSKRGRQPMCNEDRSIWITYNGEIYNFMEIKSNLIKAGHKFRSKTDTEVIIHAYEEYGRECVKLFNGMFAFAIWDSIKKELFLARDKMGIKPLYYFWDGKIFLFASEIKSLLKYGMKREVNYPALIDYLTFQYSLDDKTFFKGINSLLPANRLILCNNSLKIETYWDLQFLPQNKATIECNLQKFKHTFVDAIKRHMISDVDVGCYLSSGFDSSSVATIASRLSGKRLSTFTGTFKESLTYAYFNEINIAREIAGGINAHIHEKMITPKEIISNFYRFIYHMDEPKSGSPGISQMLVSTLSKKYVKVVLTGHGGDELFAGYPHYKSYLFKSMLAKNPLNIFRIFSFFKPDEILRSFYFLFITPFVQDSAKTGLFVYFSKAERKRLFTKEFYAKFGKYSPSSAIDSDLSFSNLRGIDKIQYIYLKKYLPSLLVMQDRVDMANSVEARVPFLDAVLVDFAIKIPLEDKLYNNELKYLIKEGMRGNLPNSVYNCPKRGFPTPYALWFKKELKSFVYEILLSKYAKKRNIFRQDYLKNLLDRFSNRNFHGKLDLIAVNKIWNLLCIEIWFRTFIDEEI